MSSLQRTIVLVALTGIALGATGRSQDPAVGRVVALLSEGRLIVADIATGETVANIVASDSPRYQIARGRIARRSASDDVFVVLPDGRVPALMTVNRRTWAATRLAQLPADDYRGLAVGAKSGRLFAFGALDRDVVIVDPRTSAVETRRIGEGNLDVFSGAVSADEQRVYLSFHGNESGVRAYDISGSTLTSLFHLRTHGNFALMGDRIFATTGGPSIEEFDRKGQRIRVIDTGLTGNHLMEFSVDDKQVLYAAGSCMYSGGLTRVELSPGTTPRILSPSGNWNGRFPQPQWEVCGERISVASSGTWLALAALRNGVSPSSARPGTILIVDARTGAILRSLATSSEVVDVLTLN